MDVFDDDEKDDIWKVVLDKTNGIKRLVCHRCGHIWNYKGRDPYRASCPKCKTSVVLKAKRIKKIG